MSDLKISIVKIAPSCKRLVVYSSDNSYECLDFNTPEEAFGVLKVMKENTPYKFLISDVCCPYNDHWSK